MARDITIDRKTMLDGAISVIETRGQGALTARALGESLSISTQPIYREFGDMDGLKKAAIERGFEIFRGYVKGEALDQAVGYVMFAAERSELFKFLFSGEHYEYDGLDDLSHKLLPDTGIIERLSEISGLEREKVFRLHLCLWMALHGLATISANNVMHLTAAEVGEFAKEISKGMTKQLKSNNE